MSHFLSQLFKPATFAILGPVSESEAWTCRRALTNLLGMTIYLHFRLRHLSLSCHVELIYPGNSSVLPWTTRSGWKTSCPAQSADWAPMLPRLTVFTQGAWWMDSVKSVSSASKNMMPSVVVLARLQVALLKYHLGHLRSEKDLETMYSAARKTFGSYLWISDEGKHSDTSSAGANQLLQAQGNGKPELGVSHEACWCLLCVEVLGGMITRLPFKWWVLVAISACGQACAAQEHTFARTWAQTGERQGCQGQGKPKIESRSESRTKVQGKGQSQGKSQGVMVWTGKLFGNNERGANKLFPKKFARLGV